MIKRVEVGAVVSIRDRRGDDSKDPVILVNVLHPPPGEIEALIAAWTDDAHHFKARPRFISAQLPRGIVGSGTSMNCAVWQSAGAFQAAFTSPEFTAKLEACPEGAVVPPNLFRKVAVDGVCVA